MINVLSKIRERRGSRRHRLSSLLVTINGDRYRTADWSAGGFRLAGVTAAFAPRDQVRGRIKMPSGLAGWFVAEVVWQSGDTIGFRFIEIESKIILDLPL